MRSRAQDFALRALSHGGKASGMRRGMYLYPPPIAAAPNS